MMRLCVIVVLGLAVCSSGCVPVYPDERPTPSQPTQALPLGERYDPSQTGRITGQVRWVGPRPELKECTGAVPTTPGAYRFQQFPAPYAPKIGESGTLADVLVSLEGVDLAKSKAWDLPGFSIFWKDGVLGFRTADKPTQSVVVAQRGVTLPIISEDTIPHNLRGRGADFFALPLPIGAKPVLRKFDKSGLVELSSGMGYFWAVADLHIVEHPYHAITKTDGSFELRNVPAGNYILRFTLRNWQVTHQERDPETGLIFRQYFAKPIEKTQKVSVIAGQSETITQQFEKP
jgi:hypothetical protein